MSEEYSNEYDELDEDTAFENHLEGESAEYEEVEEEIGTEEVDRVLESLTNLLETVESATVQEYLEEAYNQIFSLIYEEADSEEDSEEDGEVVLEEDGLEEDDEIEFDNKLDEDKDLKKGFGDEFLNEEAA